MQVSTTGSVVWATRAGGAGEAEGHAVTAHTPPKGEEGVYVTGFFAASATFGKTNFTSHGRQDIFLSKVGPETINNGKRLLFLYTIIGLRCCQ